MKIKKRDLIRLILEMSLDEMAYMGVKKIKKGDSSFFDNDPSSDPNKIEKLFTNKKFKNQADLFFGETKAFPGSNVFIVPAVGSFDWSEDSKTKVVYTIASQYKILETSSRVTVYDLNEQTMKGLLDLSQEEMEEIDSSNDVVLHVSQGQIVKDFNATVHIVFHSFFEGIIDLLEENTMSNYFPATRKALEYLNFATGPRVYGQISKNLEINTIGSIRTNATKYLRNYLREKDASKKIGTGDFFSEILTASFLRYSGAKNEVLYNDKNSPEYGEVDFEKTENLKMFLRDSANEITNFARGKILDILVYDHD